MLVINSLHQVIMVVYSDRYMSRYVKYKSTKLYIGMTELMCMSCYQVLLSALPKDLGLN